MEAGITAKESLLLSLQCLNLGDFDFTPVVTDIIALRFRCEWNKPDCDLQIEPLLFPTQTPSFETWKQHHI